MDGSFEVVEKTHEPHVRTRHRNSSENDQRLSFGLPIYTAGNLAMQRLLGSGVIRPKLAISQPGDPYEQEADRVADVITRKTEPVLARKCASCAAGAPPCPACEAEPNGMVQRKTESRAALGSSSNLTNPIHSLDAGQPLNRETRSMMEPRFGRDLSRVRVHTDSKAAESARSVNALAYTVGRDIVFGAGQYAPQTSAGQKLLAHELTHFMQQSSAAFQPMLQRACITDPECEPAEEGELPGTAVKGSAAHFHASVEREEKEKAEEEETKTPREIRDELCSKVPPDPACTADGHARKATEFEKLFRPLAPDQFALADGVYVDKAISKGVGAYVKKCTAFLPRIEGDRCIFIPDRREKQAARYNSGEKKIGGEDRNEWFAGTLGTVTHELEHVRFRKQFPKTAPRPEACDFDDISGELTELGAIMSEFPVFFRARANKSWHDRRIEMDHWFKRKLTQPSRHGERITGILKAIRCRCECVDVNAYLQRLVEFTTTSWTEVEKNTFHEELRDPKWKLDWPIQTPLPPRDIPSWMIEPTIGFGYGTFGKGGPYLSLSLDLGIPLDRTGKWQLLLGAQGRFFPGLTPDERNAYLLGLKVGFLRGPTLGYRGWQAGAFAEIGKGRLVSGAETEKGGYAGGGLSLRYTPGLEKEPTLIPFIGVDIGGGAMFDTSKPVLRKLFFVGLTAGIEF
jgi:hypothetical protein